MAASRAIAASWTAVAVLITRCKDPIAPAHPWLTALAAVSLLALVFYKRTLRLFGFIMSDTPVSTVAKQLGWISFLGLLIAAVTGVSLFASEALKCFSNNMYWYKMAFFFPATLFHFTVYRKVTRSEKSNAALRGLIGFLSLFLWFGVAVFGRAIGYF